MNDLCSLWFTGDRVRAVSWHCPQHGLEQSTQLCGQVNGFCLLIGSVPSTMCFVLPRPAKGLVGSSLSEYSKPPVLSMGCPATWLPDP